MHNDDNVLLSVSEFEKIVNELHKLRDENKELKKANYFLNKQIKEYNERFANVRK